MSDPATPLIPWDAAAITAAALDILRLPAGADDAGRVADYVPTATALCETFLDPCAAWAEVPPPVNSAAAMVTVELFRRKDAPFGVTNAWSESDYGPVRIGTDWVNSVRYLLLPYKCAWGVA